MHDLLFLCPHAPRPAVSGEAGRIWRLLRHLAARYRIHLGCFGAEDANRLEEGLFRQFCHSSYIARAMPQFKPRNRLAAAFRLGGASDGCHPGLWAWAERIWRERRPRHALAVRSALVPYVSMCPEVEAIRIVDHTELALDPDAGRWDPPEGCLRGIRRWSQRRDARAALAGGRRDGAEGCGHLIPSSRLAARLHGILPEASRRIHALPDGIDVVHFSTRHAFPNPLPHPGRTILFGVPLDGADAAGEAFRFAGTVFAILRARAPDLRFLIIDGGGNRAGAPVGLAGLPGVVVVPRTGDPRPWLARADVVVFPLARPAREPILEAMAMARPVVASTAALAELEPPPGHEIWRADSAADLAEAVRAALDPDTGASVGRAARARVQADYSWEAAMDRLDHLMDGRPACGRVRSWPMASGLGR